MISNTLTREYNTVIPLNVFVGTRTVSHNSLLDTIGTKLQIRMDNCQKKHIVMECICGELRKIPLNCQIRICPKCENVRRFKLDRKISKYFKLFSYPKLLTLTVAEHRLPDSDTKKKMELYCREFRRTLYDLPHDLRLKYRVIGRGYKISGFRFLECKPKEDGFHIHYHYIINQEYFIPQKLISEVWERVTGNSCIADIRKVSKKKGIEYALKYSSKPMDSGLLKSFGLTDKEILKVYVEFFYRKRMWSKIGDFYNINLKIYFSRYRCKLCGSTEWILHFHYENPVNHDLDTEPKDWG